MPANQISREPGKESLIYHPGKVSWVVAEIVARPPAFLGRMTLYVVIALLGSVTAYSYLSKITITVAGPGMIRTSEKPRPIRAAIGGKVAYLGVSESLHVKEGQLLLTMDELLSQQDEKAARAYIEMLRGLVSMNPDIRAMRRSAAVSGVMLRLSNNQLPQQVASLTEAQKNYDQALKNLWVATPTLTQGLKEQQRTLAGKIQKIHALRMERKLSQDLEELQTSLAQVKTGIDERWEQARQRVSGARINLEVGLKTFEEALNRHDEDQKIKAPISGIVSGMAVTGVGEVVSGGQELFQIIPEGAELVAEVQIANKDFADLRVGMPVRVKLDAYPSQDYGWIDGTVRELPPDVDRSKDAQKQEHVYKVIVGLKQPYLEFKGEKKPALLGMTLNGEIEVKKRTLLELAVSEVFKLKEQLK